MENKKKSLNIFLYTLFVMFFGFTLKSSCKAVSIDDYQLTDDIMNDICVELQLDRKFSGDYIPLLTNQFNEMMSTVRARGDNHQVTLADCIFFGSSEIDPNNFYLTVAFTNWRDYNGDASLENDFIPFINTSGVGVNGTLSNLNIRSWLHWTYNNDNTINGVQSTYSPRWLINHQSHIFVAATNNLSVRNITLTESTAEKIALDKMLILDNSSIDDAGYLMIAAQTRDYGYKFYLYSNVMYLEDYGYVPTPTSSPTSFPTDSPGGGSTDLTETNGLITGVIDSINNTPSGDDFEIPSSGDLVSSLGISDFSDFPEVAATDNFWLAITDGLYSAFTSDVRYYDLDFLGINFTLDNQSFIITNQYINSFLSIVEVVTFVFVEYKIIRKLVNMFSSGVFSQIMRAYGKIDISDLF